MQIDRRVLARAVFLLTMVFTANLALADGGEPCDVVKRLKKKLPAYATVLDLNKLAEENALLRTRVENLESSLADLRSMVNQLAADQAAKAKPIIEIGPATPPPQPAGPVVPSVAAAPKAPEKPAIRSKYNLDMYGYFKWDVAHDSARSEIGNWTRWVTSEGTNPGDRQLSMTANQTRFGFNMKGPEAGNAKVSGNLELDLYGAGTEVAPAIRARHAFLNVEWAKQDFSLLAGHTWDVISPLSPSTLDFYVRWMAGNIGARHPQLRLTKGIKLGDKSKLTLQAAASRPIGDASPLAQIDTGVDGGKPDFQGRIAVEFPTLKDKKVVIGFSGLSGEDEYDLSAAGASIKAHTRSTGIDLTLPILDKLTFKGELFRGSNLDNYMGGVGMGTIVKDASGTPIVNVPTAAMIARGALTDVTAVDTKGHWAELAIGPFSKWRYFLGISNDDPDDDVLANGMRSRNQSRWFTAMHDLNEAVQIGIELTRWATQYKNGVEGVNNRAQTSIIYKF